MFLEKSVVFIFSLIWLLSSFVSAVNIYDRNHVFDRELILTENEKNLLEKFKAAVYQDLTQEFMKQDLYLIRFLRAKNLNLEKAIRGMRDFLEFWEKNKLDNIRDEPMTEISEDFPFDTARDRWNRPVLYGSIINGWNVRRGLIQGKRPAMMRYIYKIILGANDDLVATQRTMPNVTTFNIVMNLEGFNLFQHGCPMCITTYLNLLETYERFLPHHVNEVIILNTPQAFTVVLDMVRPVLSKHTRDRLRIFGTNKGKWKAHLDALVDPSQLPWEMGGTKLESRHPE